jgi:hypothetical protein
MIYVTGDTHGGADIRKLGSKCFTGSENLTKKDYVIIAGDFGFVWDGGRRDAKWLAWLNKKPFTTLFIDGNHENFDILNGITATEWNGGMARFVEDSVIHLARGQVYTISGLKIFTFGGSESYDRFFRKEGVSWWKSEMPAREEYDTGMENLKANGWKVDYIVTHSCPSYVLEKIKKRHNKPQRITGLEEYLQLVHKKASYGKWYFGHFHIDESITLWHQAVFQRLYRLNA